MSGEVEARLRNRIAGIIHEHWPREVDHRPGCDEMQEAVGAALGGVVPSDDLGAAWRAAEEALPEGWVIGRLDRTAPAYPAEWFVTAYKSGGSNRNYDTMSPAHGPTPVAALRALASRLEAR